MASPRKFHTEKTDPPDIHISQAELLALVDEASTELKQQAWSIPPAPKASAPDPAAPSEAPKPQGGARSSAGMAFWLFLLPLVAIVLLALLMKRHG